VTPIAEPCLPQVFSELIGKRKSNVGSVYHNLNDQRHIRAGAVENPTY
jgi:hypothetical protein